MTTWRIWIAEGPLEGETPIKRGCGRDGRAFPRRILVEGGGEGKGEGGGGSHLRCVARARPSQAVQLCWPCVLDKVSCTKAG